LKSIIKIIDGIKTVTGFKKLIPKEWKKDTDEMKKDVISFRKIQDKL
jgi:hypothetical protein